MGQRNDCCSVALVAAADARRQTRDAEQAADGEPAHGDDQPRSQQLELPVRPERTELLLAGCGSAIAATREGTSWITPCHRRAIEGSVELVLLEVEPAAERLACAAAPRPPLLSFDHAGRLAVHVCALPEPLVQHRQGLEGKAGFNTGPAHAEVTLQRSVRTVERAPTRQARTTTNQLPLNTIF